MRLLTPIEQKRLEILTNKSVSLTLIEPTATGLKKSIMDATGPVRTFFKEQEIHDYSEQKQGPEYKVKVKSLIYDSQNQRHSSLASIYRPNTKKGDPRLWFSKLNRYVKANDIIGLIYFDRTLHVINLTQIPVEKLIISNQNTPIKALIEAIFNQENSIAKELLGMLKELAKEGPIPSLLKADTSVGRTLEAALKIPMNSSKQPDFKGIELKAFRSNRNNRKNLFAQVANWKLSKFKSSADILNAFGYKRDNDFKLNCTVSTIKRNSQGLMLKIDNNLNWLVENSDKKEIKDFAVWTLEKLHKRLLEKHKETFWIKAETSIVDNQEYFLYTDVEHTKEPIISQFDLLLQQGIITLDHLIKRNADGKVAEKGPLFKIKNDCIGLLFPPSIQYNLLS